MIDGRPKNKEEKTIIQLVDEPMGNVNNDPSIQYTGIMSGAKWMTPDYGVYTAYISEINIWLYFNIV